MTPPGVSQFGIDAQHTKYRLHSWVTWRHVNVISKKLDLCLLKTSPSLQYLLRPLPQLVGTLDMDHDYGPGRSQLQCCLCGKTFAQQNAFSNHLHCCKKNKSRLQMALTGTRKVWAEGQSSNKRSKLMHLSNPQDPTPQSNTAKGSIYTLVVQNSENWIVSLTHLKLSYHSDMSP